VTPERGTEVEITPEPTLQERAAVLAALDALRAVQDASPGSWWEEGVRENLVGDAGG
jgi:hypothetical protein